MRLLAVLPVDEWEDAAAAAGFVPDPEAPPTRRKQPRGPSGDGRIPQPRPQPRAAPQPYNPSELPELPFWRIAAKVNLSPDPAADEVPPGLAHFEPWAELPVSDPSLPLPRRPQARWPARVHLLIDLSLGLRPYWDDFWQLEALLRRTLGDRLHTWLTRSGDPSDVVRFPDGEPSSLPLTDGRLIVLGDAGMYSPRGAGRQRWWRFGQRCRRAGQPVLLIAPVPLRRLDAALGRWFRLVLWDRGGSLHPLPHHVSSLQESEAAKSSPPLPQGSLDLLASLAHASRVEPPLLRELRLALSERGTDIGSEYEVWHHPSVRANILACTLSPEGRVAAREAFGRLPVALQKQVAGLREQGNRHQSPLLRAEESLAEGRLASAKAWAWSQGVICRLAATLQRGSDPAVGRALGRYVQQMSARRPELLAQSGALARAWGLANRDALLAGRVAAFPPGVDLAAVKWLLAQGTDPPAVFLGQVGERLGVYPQASVQPQCHLAEVAPGAEFWQIDPEAADGAETPVQVLTVGEGWTPAAGRRYRLTIGRRQLELEAVRRPAWAAGIGRCAEGLFVERDDGRRAFWIPRGPVPVAGQSVSVEDPMMGTPWTSGVMFVLPHGFWWHEDEYLTFLGAGEALTPPHWASHQGIDRYGYWAEFEVKGVVQRLPQV